MYFATETALTDHTLKFIFISLFLFNVLISIQSTPQFIILCDPATIKLMNTRGLIIKWEWEAFILDTDL